MTTAWSPGHLSCMFEPVEVGGELVGSRGVGICIDRGVTTTLSFDEGGGSEHEVANAVLETMEVEASAQHRVDVPAGAGFGASGAVALSTALAAANATGQSYNAAARAAHDAELRCSTGLGDVPAQCLGGIVMRNGPGVPPDASLDRIPAPPLELRYEVMGSRGTAGVLEGLRDVEAPELAALSEDPTVENLLRLSREFSRRTGLTTERVRNVLRGAEGFQPHLGETVVTLGGPGEPAQISVTGAHVREVEP